MCVWLCGSEAPNHGMSFMPSPGCQDPWQNEAKLRHANTAIKAQMSGCCCIDVSKTISAEVNRPTDSKVRTIFYVVCFEPISWIE